MSTLQFHLSFNNGAERLQLPVNPESIRISSSRGFEDVEVTQLGEYTVIGNEKLREFSFSSFFPRDYNPSYCEYEPFPNPWEAVALLEKWRDTARPMRLTITGTPINVPVTLRLFEYREEGGAVGDIAFDITFKEYRFIEFQRVKTQTTAVDSVEVTAETARPDSSNKRTEYVVVSRDSLWKISARADVYGDADKWRKLYNANKKLIGANPNLIFPGQKLVIPRD
ncbi:LysM peptidoglycan-binding domain-containing protein [Paenibacillus elgii]|uniref:LysM peptidoglycan-binding domain-containing protein n=1 Tax=Paenibacillus elgii TaxID=189691 RepID=UPI000248CEEB|nr:LysM peptidoglycan-binding domain-containing protein [Paenibacillus elgii]